MAKKKYCSECKQVLENPRALVCDKCGRATTPIDKITSIQDESILTAKEKRGLDLIAVLNFIMSAISIGMVLILASQMKDSAELAFAAYSNGVIDYTEYSIYETLATVLGVAKYIVIFTEAFNVLLAIMVLLKKSWAVRVIRVFVIINTILNFLSGSIFAGILGLYIIFVLRKIISRMVGGEEYEAAMAEKKRVQDEIDSNPDIWQCKGCGFVNPKTLFECKSCGENRR